MNDCGQAKILERAPLTRQDEWEQVADSLHEPIAPFDTSHRLFRINKAMAAILDESGSDLIGSVRYLSTAGFADRKRARKDLDLLQRHEAVSGRFYAQDQAAFYEVKITPYYGRDSLSLAGCVYIARDIANF